MLRSVLLTGAAVALMAACHGAAQSPSQDWTIISSAQAQRVDPLIEEGQRIIALFNAFRYDDVLAQVPPLLEKIKSQSGENNQLYFLMLQVMGKAYLLSGHPADAEPMLKHVLEIQAQRFGPDSFQAELATNDLAAVEEDLSNFKQAETLFQRCLDLVIKLGGAGTEGQAQAISNMAYLYQKTGRYGAAEAMFKQAFAMFEQVLNTSFPNPGRRQGDRAHLLMSSVAQSTSDLAYLYVDLGRYAEAEPLFVRAMALRDSALGSAAYQDGGDLKSLGIAYRHLGRPTEAEQALKHALDIAANQRKLPPSSPAFAQIFNELTNVYVDLGRYGEAETAGKHAIDVYEKSLGAGHPEYALALDSLGAVYMAAGRYADAESVAKRALEIDEKALGPNHHDVSLILNTLAASQLATGQIDQALVSSRRSAQIAAALLSASAGVNAGFDLAALRPAFEINLQVLEAARSASAAATPFADEALRMSQWANQSTAAVALNQMALRVGAGSDALAALVRQQQDATAEYRGLDKNLVDELGKPANDRNAAHERTTRSRMSELDGLLKQLNQRLASEFPEYAALISTQPLAASDVQKLLSDDEALVFFLVGEKATQIFAVTRTSLIWQTAALAADDIAKKVAAFRHGLDVEEFENSVANGKPILFDLGLAHDLYAALLQPVEGAIKDKKRLIVVPTGALTALPFHLLVTDAPAQTSSADEMAVYRNAAWLVNRQATSVLPSVASLKALRMLAHKDEAPKPLIGFADPIFNAGAEAAAAARGVHVRAAAPTRSLGDYWQGVGVEPSRLAQALPRLPDTADELRAVAQKLGASQADIHLRADASETNVKRLPLADYRVVYFATHGLVAGDVKGLAEPSLALTLPKTPSAADDGLLTASEVAQLKLNADWVVLSACNTVAGDRPGAEAMSGLARAFFYAGARALLVSHWSVASAAATRLTTSTFDILQANPALGRAEALRRAMLAFRADNPSATAAYPAYWGPFEVIGEGTSR